MDKKGTLSLKQILYIFLGVLALFCLILAFHIDAGRKETDYTVFSTNNKGISIFYESLPRYGMPAGIATTPLGKSLDDAHFMISPSRQTLKRAAIEDVYEWIFQGGTVIFAEVDGELRGNKSMMETVLNNDFIETFSNLEGCDPVETNGEFTAYNYGYGKMLFIDARYLTNQYIKENREISYELVKYLKATGKSIYFNEYYHGFSSVVEGNIWLDSPDSIKVLVIQFIICMFFLLWHLGKRFGASEAYYEESERLENEYILAMGNLFFHHKHWEYVAKKYQDNLLEALGNYAKTATRYVAEDPFTFWRQYNLPYEATLHELLSNIPTSKQAMNEQVKKYNILQDILLYKGKH